MSCVCRPIGLPCWCRPIGLPCNRRYSSHCSLTAKCLSRCATRYPPRPAQGQVTGSTTRSQVSATKDYQLLSVPYPPGPTDGVGPSDRWCCAPGGPPTPTPLRPHRMHYPSIHLSTHPSMHPSINTSIHNCMHASINPSIHLPTQPPTLACACVHVCVCMQACARVHACLCACARVGWMVVL